MAGARFNLVIAPEHLFDCFICPRCRDILAAPIVICPSGHSVCWTCAFVDFDDNGVEVRRRCPTCKLGFPTPTIRNELMERAVSEITFSCRYTGEGCKETFPSIAEWSLHASECKFREILCSECHENDQRQCTDEMIPFTQFVSHLTNFHHVRVSTPQLETETLAVWYSVQMFHVPLIEYSRQMYILRFDGHNFLAKYRLKNGRFSVAVLMCAAPAFENKYEVNLSIVMRRGNQLAVEKHFGTIQLLNGNVSDNYTCIIEHPYPLNEAVFNGSDNIITFDSRIVIGKKEAEIESHCRKNSFREVLNRIDSHSQSKPSH